MGVRCRITGSVGRHFRQEHKRVEPSAIAHRPHGLNERALERPGLSFPCRPHGEPDLLTKGELKRMAVGVGNPRGIANGVARIDRSACRSALAAGLGI